MKELRGVGPGFRSLLAKHAVKHAESSSKVSKKMGRTDWRAILVALH
jgi:hypothetical protein